MRFQERREPRVVSHFPSLSRYGDIDPTSHMFIQDVHLAVMPIGGRTEKRPDFMVEFRGPESDREKAVVLCGSIAREEGHGLNELVCDTVQEIAMHLAWQGKAVHEIIPDNDEPRKYYLESFTTKRLIKVPGFYVQIVPRKDYKLVEKWLTVVRAKDIWEVPVPAILGGAWGYRRILSGLRRYKHLGPPFWQSDLQRQMQTQHFSFQEYVTTTEFYYTKLTKRWGWNRRDYTQRNNTEFYIFYKGITFRWAQAVVREHIIEELNTLLRRLGINSEIIVIGLPLAKDILKFRQEMLDGKLTFGKAHDMTSI